MSKRISPIPLSRTPFQAAENIYLDLRYGRKLLDGEKLSPFYEQGCFHTQSIEYEELKNVFSYWPLKESDAIMDIGCGRGRIFNYLLSRKFKGHLYGVEIDPEIASFTEKRLKPYSNVTIFTGNALDYVRENITIYFLFNPFNEKNMDEFIKKIQETHESVRIIYYYPQCISRILSQSGFSGTEIIYHSVTRKSDLPCYYLEYKKTKAQPPENDMLPCQADK